MLEEIITYLQLQPRNKLIVSSEKLKDLIYCDIGLEVANSFVDVPISKHFSLRAKTVISQIIASAEIDHPLLGRILALENLGILLEPELKFNFVDFLENTSKDIAVILNWDGEINNKKIYFLNQQDGKEIDLQHLSFLKYEI
jgi:hypothetical protein